jgi:hypothetical protein
MLSVLISVAALALIVGEMKRWDEREIVFARNRTARRLFSTMDDIFYGKRPSPKDPPAWAGFRR